MAGDARASKSAYYWKVLAIVAACAAAVAVICLRAHAGRLVPYTDTAAHTKVGERMPPITVQEVSGKTFRLADEKGKVVVVNFWATWCPPCRAEMPQLEKEIWAKYGSRPDFAMVAIAREQSQATIAGFEKQHAEFKYPLAYDPQRKVYAEFADLGIPRSYVVGRDGKIAFQSVGYGPGEVDELDRAVEKALDK